MLKRDGKSLRYCPAELWWWDDHSYRMRTSADLVCWLLFGEASFPLLAQQRKSAFQDRGAAVGGHVGRALLYMQSPSLSSISLPESVWSWGRYAAAHSDGSRAMHIRCLTIHCTCSELNVGLAIFGVMPWAFSISRSRSWARGWCRGSLKIASRLLLILEAIRPNGPADRLCGYRPLTVHA